MARGAIRIPIYDQRTSPSGLGHVPRASAGDAGRGLQQIGAAVGDWAKVLQDKQDAEDRIAALKAVTESELSLQEHFSTLQNKARPGGAGITGDYIKTIDEYRAKALEGASGNYAKHFDLHFGNLRERLARGAMEWEVGESRRFHLQSIQDTADAAEKIVGADPSQFETHMGRLVNAIRNDARLTPKQRDDAQEYARKSLAAAAMQGEIARNPQAYLKPEAITDSAPWKLLTFEERQRAVQFAHAKRKDQIDMEVGAEVDALWSRMGPRTDADAVNLDAMGEQVRSRWAGDADAQKVAMALLRERASTHDYAVRQREAAQSGAIWSAVLDGAGLAKVRAMPEYRSLDGAKRAQLVTSIEAFHKRNATGGGSSEDKLGQFTEFWKVSSQPERLAAMSDGEIFALAPKIGPAYVKHLLETRQKLANAPEKVIEARIDEDSFKHHAREAGIDPADKKEAALLGSLKYKVETLIDAEQRKRGKPLQREEKDAILRAQLAPVIVNYRTWYGSSTQEPAPLFQVQDQRAIVMPQGAEREQVLRALRDAGIDSPSERQIAQGYARLKASK